MLFALEAQTSVCVVTFLFKRLDPGYIQKSTSWHVQDPSNKGHYPRAKELLLRGGNDMIRTTKSHVILLNGQKAYLFVFFPSFFCENAQGKNPNPVFVIETLQNGNRGH